MSLLWFLHDIRSPLLTAIFQFFTYFGEELIVVTLLCVLYWCVDKKAAFAVGITFFLSALVVQGFKVAIRVDRPWILDPAFAPVASALETATGYSFPSGHTQSAAAVIGTWGLYTRKKGWIAASWGLVLLVGISRMYLGVHTPWDVAASLCITLAIALVVLAYLRSGRSDVPLMVVLFVVSVVVLAYALVLHGRGVIETHYLADCTKAAAGCVGCAIALLWAKRRIPFSVQTPRLWQQGLKLLIGLAGLLVIKSGGKLLLGTSLIADGARYFLIAVWALAVYPLCFSKVIKA